MSNVENPLLPVECLPLAQLSYQVLTEAYGQHHEEPQPAFYGKPVKYLNLRIVSLSLSSAMPDRQEFYITPLKRELPNWAPGSLFDSESLLPEDQQPFSALVSQVGNTVLQPETDLAELLSPTLMHGTYGRQQKTSRAVHVGMYDHMQYGLHYPNSVHMLTATKFAQRSLAYVGSEEFRYDTSRARDYARKRGRGSFMIHALGFDHVPELPLNGHEPEGFLMAYSTKMLKRAGKFGASLARLDQLKTVQQDNPLVEMLTKQRDASVGAYRRAQSILQQK